jgi:hypothetical protein
MLVALYKNMFSVIVDLLMRKKGSLLNVKSIRILLLKSMHVCSNKRPFSIPLD